MYLSLRSSFTTGCERVAAITSLLFGLATVAVASPITYTFTGTGSGTVNGNAFNGTFTITDVADTTGITSGGGEYRNTPSSSVFSSGAFTANLVTPLVIENTVAPGFMGFSESVTPFNDESLTNSVFETYALNTALPLTSGGLSVATGTLGTFPTDTGVLVFSSITALSFQATTAAPEPAAFCFAGIGLGSLFILRRRRHSLPQ